ncbi:MAG: nucleoside kinase [Prevotella sp.]|nr:nucleoside kinase [Prevotella sp.]
MVKIEKNSVEIRCKNNEKTIKVDIGSTLYDVFQQLNLQMDYGPVSAKVNNKVEGLHYRVYNPKLVEYLSLSSESGMRAYTRTLFFVLAMAVRDLYPEGRLVIGVPVSNGYYCELVLGCEVTPSVVADIERRMRQIVAAALPIHRHEVPTEQAIDLFSRMGSTSKVKLLKTLGRLYTLYYEIDGYVDYFYGTMLTNTSQLTLFALESFRGGLLLRTPSRQDPSQLGKAVAQDKMFDVFQEHHRLQRLLGVSTVGDFNELVQRGAAVDVVNVSEALQEKKLALIAEQIVARKTVRMVLIAGPSSSGKTTTCKRLSVQLLSSGIKPIPISLDDYFLDRELSPVDERGEYDFESLYALNLPLLNEQMNSLFRGEEVELPRYDFTTGKSLRSGRRLRLHDNEVLVVEGIHALNPELTSRLPAEQLFKVYASALTTIMLDDHNYIPTTDNRLLRRIIRDCKYRGMSARETLRRWPSVREGENKWIFPYQENADVMFNSAMIYELAVIRTQAESVLDKVPENCDEYAEAYRLLKFLRYFEPLEPGALPPTSLLREFLGGSTFRY